MTKAGGGSMDWRYEESLREKRQLDSLSAKVEAAKAENAALRGRADSRNYEIKVSVNGTELTELDLGAKALRLPPERLSSEILKCIRSAEADYGRASMQLLRETLGNTGFVQDVSGRVKEAYPFPNDGEDRSVRDDDDLSDDDDDEGGWNRPILRS